MPNTRLSSLLESVSQEMDSAYTMKIVAIDFDNQQKKSEIHIESRSRLFVFVPPKKLARYIP